jgi:hypothetical protein
MKINDSIVLMRGSCGKIWEFRSNELPNSGPGPWRRLRTNQRCSDYQKNVDDVPVNVRSDDRTAKPSRANPSSAFLPLQCAMVHLHRLHKLRRIKSPPRTSRDTQRLCCESLSTLIYLEAGRITMEALLSTYLPLGSQTSEMPIHRRNRLGLPKLLDVI